MPDLSTTAQAGDVALREHARKWCASEPPAPPMQRVGISGSRGRTVLASSLGAAVIIAVAATFVALHRSGTSSDSHPLRGSVAQSALSAAQLARVTALAHKIAGDAANVHGAGESWPVEVTLVGVAKLGPLAAQRYVDATAGPGNIRIRGRTVLVVEVIGQFVNTTIGGPPGHHPKYIYAVAETIDASTGRYIVATAFTASLERLPAVTVTLYRR